MSTEATFEIQNSNQQMQYVIQGQQPQQQVEDINAYQYASVDPSSYQFYTSEGQFQYVPEQSYMQVENYPVQVDPSTLQSSDQYSIQSATIPTLNSLQPSMYSNSLLSHFQTLSLAPAVRTRSKQPRRVASVEKKKKKEIKEPMDLASVFQYQNQDDQSIACDICLCKSSEDSDAIIVCDTCLVAVHQSCYAREIKDSIPEGEWHCERCRVVKEHKNNDFSSVCCRLCKKYDGALVKAGHFWYHIQCVNWTMELWFEDDDKKDKLCGSVAKDKRTEVSKDKCEFCLTEKVYCVRCDLKECNKRFCVRCAAKNGIIRDDDEMDVQRHPEKEDLVYLFCNEHRMYGINLIKNNDFSKFVIEEKEEDKKCSKEKKEKKKKEKKEKKEKRKNNKNCKKIVRCKTSLGNEKKGEKSNEKLTDRIEGLENLVTLLASQINGNSSIVKKLRSVTSDEILNLMSKLPNASNKKDTKNKRLVRSKPKAKSPKKVDHKSKRNNSADKRRKVSKQSLVKTTAQITTPISPEVQSIMSINSMLDQFNTSLNLNDPNKMRKSKQQSIVNSELPLKYKIDRDVKKILKFKSDIASKEDIQAKIVEIAKSKGAIENQNPYYTMLFKFPELQKLIEGDICETHELTNRLISKNLLKSSTESCKKISSSDPITLNIKTKKRRGGNKKSKTAPNQEVKPVEPQPLPPVLDSIPQTATYQDYSFNQTIPQFPPVSVAPMLPSSNINWNDLLANPMIQELLKKRMAP